MRLQKKISYLTVFLLSLSTLLFFQSCTEKPKEGSGESPVVVNISPLTSKAQEGLNLRAIGEMAPKLKSATELEALLNDPKSGLNRLDLNSDGEVDKLKVQPFQKEGKWGYLILNPATQAELAFIEINNSKSGDDSSKKATSDNSSNSNSASGSGFGSSISSMIGQIGTFFLFSELLKSRQNPQPNSNYGQHQNYNYDYKDRPNSYQGRQDYQQQQRQQQTAWSTEQQKEQQQQQQAQNEQKLKTQKNFKIREDREKRPLGFGGFGRSSAPAPTQKRTFFSQRSRSFGQRRR